MTEISKQDSSTPGSTRSSASVESELARIIAESDQKERLYDAILSSTPDLVYVFDLDYRFTYANRALLQMWGRTLEDSVGKGLLELGYEPWHAEMHEREIDYVVATRQPIRGEVSFPHAALGVRTYDYIFVPVLDANGKVERVAGTTRDVTERKKTEEALRDSQSKLLALNDMLEHRIEERTQERNRVWRNSRDLIAVVNKDGIFESVSPACIAILGYEPEEFIGRGYVDFLWPEDRERTRIGHDSAAREQNLTGFENRYRHKDGTMRWISWNTTFEGDLIYGYGRDITEEKRREEALQAAEDQLRQAQKMEAVGQLTGGLAHDFNNLLAGISGSLELMNTRIAQGRIGELARYISAAQGGVKRAAALTHRLLAFSRRQTLDPKPVQVNRLVGGMEDLIRRTIGPSIELEFVGASGLWTTFADSNQLENSLLNLCINARDAMPDGGRLKIETANRSFDETTGREIEIQPGQYVSLCVDDTGIGMTSDIVRRVFDPFFTTKPIGLGTGLGLSMIYGFAKQSGGEVRINSEVGRGTSVCIYLPRFQGEADGEETAAQRKGVPRARNGETVLVVDDEPTIRMLVTETLEELGYGAIEAIDGATAMRVVQSDERIDLLVTDVGLPGGMNGRQVADAARQLRPGLKVLFITGYAENAAVGSEHLEAGMQVLTKPFAMEDLARRIKEIVTPQ